MTIHGVSRTLYRHRFEEASLPAKKRIWEVLCRHFFQRYVDPDATVLDLGAGYCEFLHGIRCSERIAVDLNPDVRSFAPDGTRIVLAPSTAMDEVGEATVDVVFASNFFEHLPNTEAFLDTLVEIRRVLRPGGRLLVLQPNIAAVGGQYWDFLDHHLPLTEKTVVEGLEVSGFEVREVRARFLPYTTKSRLPQHPALVRIYLRVPIAHRLLGGQAWVVAETPDR